MIVASLAAVAVVLAPTAAHAVPKEHKGMFIAAEKRASQPHRAYFRVASTNHGDKDCTITVLKTTTVSLGTDGESSWFHIFFVKPVNADRAVAIATAILNEPTKRVLCSH